MWDISNTYAHLFSTFERYEINTNKKENSFQLILLFSFHYKLDIIDIMLHKCEVVLVLYIKK